MISIHAAFPLHVSVKPAPTASASAEPADEPIASSKYDFATDEEITVTEGTDEASAVFAEDSPAHDWFYNFRGEQGGNIKISNGSIAINSPNNQNNNYMGKHADAKEKVPEDTTVTFKFDYSTSGVSNTSNMASEIHLASTDETAVSWSNTSVSFKAADAGITTANTPYEVEITVDNVNKTVTVNAVDKASAVSLTAEPLVLQDTSGKGPINSIYFRPGRNQTDTIANYSDAVYKTEVEPEESTAPKYSITTEADEADAEVKYYAVTTSSEPAPEESPEATPIVTESKEPIEALDDVKPGTVVEYEVTEKKSVADGYTYTVDVTGADAKDNRFTMPEGNVTVKVTATQTMLADRVPADADLESLVKFISNASAGQTTGEAEAPAKSYTEIDADSITNINYDLGETLKNETQKKIWISFDVNVAEGEVLQVTLAGADDWSNPGPTIDFKGGAADVTESFDATKRDAGSNKGQENEATLKGGKWYNVVLSAIRYDTTGYASNPTIDVYPLEDDDTVSSEAVITSTDMVARNISNHAWNKVEITKNKGTGEALTGTTGKPKVDNMIAYTSTKTYGVSVDATGATASEENESTAREGALVTVSVTPSSSSSVFKSVTAEPDSVEVQNNGNSFSFTMPAQDVKLTVVYEEFKPYTYTNDFDDATTDYSLSAFSNLLTSLNDGHTSATIRDEANSVDAIKLLQGGKNNANYKVCWQYESGALRAHVEGENTKNARAPRAQFYTPSIPEGGQVILSFKVKGAVAGYWDSALDAATEGAYAPSKVTLFGTDDNSYKDVKIVIKSDGGTFKRTITVDSVALKTDETGKSTFPVIIGGPADANNVTYDFYIDDVSIKSDNDQIEDN